ARRLLAEGGPSNVSFTNVARAAKVGRQTLYTHWQTPERLLAEAILDEYGGPSAEDVDSVVEAVRASLLGLRETMSEPARGVAVATLTALAFHDMTSRDALHKIGADWFATFNASLRPLGVTCTLDEYALIVGPVFFLVFLLREPVTDALIERIVTHLSPVIEPTSTSTSAPPPVPATAPPPSDTRAPKKKAS
ncbi:MAG: TetR family transcriptional regulator, partial [Ilumatobacteraceae bacterium]|nr:TetR family transcriptional regulator [Ilumatobacteraceae bacterium]